MKITTLIKINNKSTLLWQSIFLVFNKYFIFVPSVCIFVCFHNFSETKYTFVHGNSTDIRKSSILMLHGWKQYSFLCLPDLHSDDHTGLNPKKDWLKVSYGGSLEIKVGRGLEISGLGGIPLKNSLGFFFTHLNVFSSFSAFWGRVPHWKFYGDKPQTDLPSHASAIYASHSCNTSTKRVACMYQHYSIFSDYGTMFLHRHICDMWSEKTHHMVQN